SALSDSQPSALSLTQSGLDNTTTPAVAAASEFTITRAGGGKKVGTGDGEEQQDGMFKELERWQREMPTEAEMRPKDKYTMFDRKEKRYRKGVHSMSLPLYLPFPLLLGKEGWRCVWGGSDALSYYGTDGGRGRDERAELGGAGMGEMGDGVWV
ncbi:MAG: hypothetical protein Q9174_007063, partial [Haloplaca sp. 1 TL-2023]